MTANTEVPQTLQRLDPEQRAALARQLKRRRVAGHSLVAQTLKQLGVTHIHGISGIPVDATLAACATNGMRVIHPRHQQGAVMASLAQNYGAGRLVSAVILSPGPALTNALSGVLIARDNGWPLVILGGGCPLEQQGMGAFQDLDALPLLRPLTKFAAVVTHTSHIPEVIQQAATIAQRGHPGPVYVELPEDILMGQALPLERKNPPPIHASAAKPDLSGDGSQLLRATELLKQAKRPLLLLGKGVRWSAPSDVLTRLVETWGFPFITSPMGRGFLPEDHPMCANLAASELQAEADTVLVLGARLDWTFRFGAQLNKWCRIIQVDSDPAAIGLNRAVEVGVNGDVRVFLEALEQQLQGLPPMASDRDKLAPWHRRLEQLRPPRQQKLDRLCQAEQLPMTPHRMMAAIRDWLPRDAICIFDANITMAAAQQVLPCFEPASRLTPGTNGCLGIGLPYAIGLKLQFPERVVVAISGDFAFGLTAMELETAVRHQVPIIVLVANNDGSCGNIRQKNFYPPDYPERVTQFQPGVEYNRMMALFGGFGEHVERPEQLRGALDRALTSGQPACINVRVDPDAPYPRPL